MGVQWRLVDVQNGDGTKRTPTLFVGKCGVHVRRSKRKAMMHEKGRLVGVKAILCTV